MLETADEFDVAEHPECCEVAGLSYKNLCEDLQNDTQKICFFGTNGRNFIYSDKSNILNEMFLREMADFPTCSDVLNGSCKNYSGGEIHVHYDFQGNFKWTYKYLGQFLEYMI